MILVAAAEHSGASLWMAALAAAGFPAIGEGAGGSALRGGVYYATNPDPKTGEYLAPEAVAHHALRLRIGGLVRTDLAYVGRVIATVRDHREYVASVESLRALSTDAAEGPPAWLVWWTENYALLRDVATRRYPVHVESYRRLTAEPEACLRDAIRWLGRGDADAAVLRVKPEPVRLGSPDVPGLPPEVVQGFDALYAAVEARTGITPELVSRLNRTHRALLPDIVAAERR